MTNVKQQSSETTEGTRILLMTYVFGEEAANKRYLRMFLQSVKTTGVDLVIVGDTSPPYELPSNVKHVPISWPDFVRRVSDRIFDGKSLDNLQNAPRYKIIDFKPLFGHLFPELLDNYNFWGHVDNDMLLGNLRNFLTSDVLHAHDIISGIPDHPAWGPFTLYRNTETINTLFRLADVDPEKLFAGQRPVCFDEWGQCGFRRILGSSMSGIIEKHQERLGLRVLKGIEPRRSIVWDGICKFRSAYKVDPHRCAECHYSSSRGTLELRNNADASKSPVFLCHYEYAKGRLETSLETRMEKLLAAGEFQVNFRDGFDTVTP